MIKVAIAGGSGYTGGELLRLLLSHPGAEITHVTSQRFPGKFVTKAHANLRKQTSLKFIDIQTLGQCDTLFLCLPQGESMTNINKFRGVGVEHHRSEQ